MKNQPSASILCIPAYRYRCICLTWGKAAFLSVQVMSLLTLHGALLPHQGPGEHGRQHHPALLQRGHLHPGHRELGRSFARDPVGDLTVAALSNRVYGFSPGRAESRWATLSAVPRTDVVCTASTVTWSCSFEEDSQTRIFLPAWNI